MFTNILDEKGRAHTLGRWFKVMIIINRLKIDQKCPNYYFTRLVTYNYSLNLTKNRLYSLSNRLNPNPTCILQKKCSPKTTGQSI